MLAAVASSSVVGASPGSSYLSSALEQARKMLQADAATELALQEMMTTYENVMNFIAPADTDCDPSMVRAQITECNDFTDAMTKYLNILQYEACFVDSSPEHLSTITTELMEHCGTFGIAEASTTGNECVHRFREGNYDGQVAPAEPFEPFSGGTNQYAWASDFNKDLGIGIVIHSAGAGRALQGGISTPTFTLRDMDSNIVFKGVGKAADDDTTPIAGLRSAVIVDFDASSQKVTVVASTVDLVNGEFFTYELFLDQFDGTTIVRDIAPVAAVEFESPSVRTARLISNDIILFAPLFDITGGVGRAFLKFYNWRTRTILPTEFLLTTDEPNFSFSEDILTGLVWDVECFENGLCWLNTIEIQDFFPNIPFDNNVNPILSYFPLSEIAVFTGIAESNPTALPPFIFISTTELSPNFGLEYSAQSIEPVTPEAGVICTLSGFLFRIGFLTQSITGLELDDLNARRVLQVEPTDFSALGLLLPTFELGQPQECSLCQGDLNFVQTRRFRSFFGRFFRPPPPSPGSCAPINIQGQKSTTAYIWAVEECGGKVYAVTYDISSVLAFLLLRIQIFVEQQIICRIPGVADDVDECVDSRIEETLNFYNVNQGLQLQQQAMIASQVFGETITPNDFGFDLFVSEISDLFNGNPTFTPVTLNGFREISPALGPPQSSQFPFPFGFAPDSEEDTAVRVMSCQKSSNPDIPDTLVLGGALFVPGASSNTFEVNTECMAM